MIRDAILQAQKAHRSAIEETYDGVCTVYVKEKMKDPDTKITEFAEVAKLENEPCHLSFSSLPVSSESGSASQVTQVIKLFLAPGKEILPGSKIVVTQQGRTEVYSRSGKAAVYPSHQEINLELFDGWA